MCCIPARDRSRLNESDHKVEVENVKTEDEYYYESFTVYLLNGNPELRQYRSQIYRRSDGRLLGDSTSYSRVGGDMTGPWQPSSFMCPANEGFNYLMKQIFIKN